RIACSPADGPLFPVNTALFEQSSGWVGSVARMRIPPRGVAATIAIACTAVYGCGKGLPTHTSEGSKGAVAAVGEHGAGGISTKNTTRLGGATSIVDAAAVAVAVYPGLTPATRPRAVVLVDEGNWPAALAASTLAGRPLHAPLLFSEGGALPGASVKALGAMHPTGAGALEGAQVVGVGQTTAPAGYVARTVTGGDSAALAVAVEQLASSLRKRTPRGVIVTASDGAPAMTSPAAGLAAQTGAPILFVRRSKVPKATANELQRLGKPSMYVVGPSSVVSETTMRELEGLGKATRIQGPDPSSNAVAVARFSNGVFGWGVVEPGHGLVFANSHRPLDGPAAAPLAATGDYAPLLLLEGPARLGSALGSYLADLQPGTPPSGPVHGVYNHGWVMGDESAITAATQARIDATLEISSREATEPTPASQAAGGESTGP
ncbi:MAG: cell wall-binding repeat-containing protein, partial [Solirubrobacteraceae bacterium]